MPSIYIALLADYNAGTLMGDCASAQTITAQQCRPVCRAVSWTSQCRSSPRTRSRPHPR